MADAPDIIPPNISVQKCEELLQKLYGIKCQQITQLNGYDDRNFKVIPKECDNEFIESCSAFVLKVMNSQDSRNISMAEAQNGIMLHLVRAKCETMTSTPYINPPNISADECEELLQKLYGIKCEQITQLNGYDDRNFKVIPKECDNEYIESCAAFVFKVMNSLDSRNFGLVEAQNGAMLYLAENNVKCTKVLKNIHGNYCSKIKLSDNEHIVRLMEFVPGKILSDVKPSNDIFYALGKFIANFDCVLKKFHHPSIHIIKFTWMLNAVPDCKRFTYIIESTRDREMIESSIDNFAKRTLQNKFEKGIIHGDFNEQNIIIDDGTVAIIDFGDCQYNCYVYELGIALAYVMLYSEDLNSAGHVLAGYSTVRNIPDEEFDVLKCCVEARLCQSIVLGLYNIRKKPDNPYILCSQAKAWKLLRILWKMTEEELYEKWNCVMNDYKDK